MKAILFFVFSFNASAQLCVPALESLPILQGGRVKPLHVHARQSLRFLTGKASMAGENPVVTYCRLSINDAQAPQLSAPVEHKKLQALLELPKGVKRLPYKDLHPHLADIRQERARHQEGDGYQKALDKLLSRLHLHQEITRAHNWTIPKDGDWVPLIAFGLSPDSSPQILLDTAQGHTSHLLELTYARLRLPIWSLALSLIALASLTLLQKFPVTLALAGISALLQASLITLRVLISGRAPITNMYETVLFSGLGALLLALLLYLLKKEKVFVYLGLAWNACTLLMLNFADGMLSEEISPLVPVLRDNFWLSTHVTTVIMAYGALALSWVLANTVLFKRRFGRMTPKEERHYAKLTHSCLKYGVVLLAAGIILGGVWADYSWGRFWGWDPKETGSLIALCLYVAILHGRHTNWIPQERFMALTAAAFLSIMMAWFGVNYILASGLHSYGFSEGGALFLASFSACQLGFLALCCLPRPAKNV